MYVLFYNHNFLFQFLNEEDYDSKKSQEIATLDQTLLVQKQVSADTPENSPFRELAARGTSTNHIAASWMLQATWLATVASCHIVRQTLLISL